MNGHKLAIIIPAYKAEFLEETLSSLCKQSDLRFTVYIGDDASPYDLRDIVARFEDKLSIIYCRFETNLGAVSLTKQWERCVDLSNEEWIWLFSDDDIMDKNAVQVFYDSVNENCMLYKFHTQVIDENGDLNPFYEKFDYRNNFKDVISSADFIRNRLACNGFRSFAVEYIFHRSFYKKFGFIDFPLAWGSDDATWLLYSLVNHRQIGILDTNVYWRYSGINISSDSKSILVVEKKIAAAIQYVKWIQATARDYNIVISDTLFLHWISMQIVSLRAKISYAEYQNLIRKSTLNIGNFKLWFTYIRIIKRRQFINLLKNSR
ncbi:glycosyltransferase family 2 protein [Sphingobacterium sp. JUb56]|uniref:glycosyltransferase family 2 protein n=1 Tax=Sphingobacterium sp. JUb56 TaxID=2587145 RepID=UPI00160CF6F7|nr:glycosyltransferase family 2 protein [Sphingobacterium sp. JUb56]MBB2954349.1 glycosyltransferase involved in cell wall biosynthesis [Sphingobacterium sp. JUb56]